MTRGDVVVVAAPGDYGKPRPAVIVQSDAFPPRHPSVIICQMTSELLEDADFRVTGRARSGNRPAAPIADNGRQAGDRSSERIGRQLGRLTAADLARLNVALAFVLGLAD